MEKSILVGDKNLRYGYTTGSCAAAATKAALTMFFSKKEIEYVNLSTPKGFDLKLEVLDIEITDGYAVCAIKKDSGDDPDITNGMLIYSKVKKIDSGIEIFGGVGIGKVTKKGLSVEVGKSAINPTPYKMIESEVKEICDKFNYAGGVSVEIFAPQGYELSKKTFNEKLGIVGGLSILGTTGIVEPMSEKALLNSLVIELDVIKAKGQTSVMFCPGNYGIRFAGDELKLDTFNSIKISNYVGDMFLAAKAHGFKRVLFISHIGKAVKLAGGMMNTHSKYGDCRKEIFASCAVESGCDIDLVKSILNCNTTDEIIDIIKNDKRYKNILDTLLNRIYSELMRRTNKALDISIVVFSNVYGVLFEKDEHGLIEEFTHENS